MRNKAHHNFLVFRRSHVSWQLLVAFSIGICLVMNFSWTKINVRHKVTYLSSSWQRLSCSVICSACFRMEGGNVSSLSMHLFISSIILTTDCCKSFVSGISQTFSSSQLLNATIKKKAVSSSRVVKLQLLHNILCPTQRREGNRTTRRGKWRAHQHASQTLSPGARFFY